MNRKNVLVSNLVFGLLMVSAAQCPSKSKDGDKGGVEESYLSDCVGGIRSDISRLLKLKEGEFDKRSKAIVEGIKERLVEFAPVVNGEGLVEGLEGLRKWFKWDSGNKVTADLSGFLKIVVGKDSLVHGDLGVFRDGEGLSDLVKSITEESLRASFKPEGTVGSSNQV